MPSTFSKLPLTAGGGRLTDGDGHADAIVEVLQTEDNGNTLVAQNERFNTFSLQSAKSAVGGMGSLDLDRIECNQNGDVPSQLKWTFYYSNDGFYGLGTLGTSETAIITGAFNSSNVEVKRSYPALVKTYVKALGGAFGVDSDIPVYQAISLDNVPPESMKKWQVKVTTNVWNVNIELDILERHHTIHVINGRLFMFNGVSSLRKRSDSLYEVTYEWLLDGGTKLRQVSSDQPDTDRQLILPPVVPVGDPALDVPGSGADFDGDTYIRLPYHAVTLGVPETTGAQPPFIQFPTATFDPTKYGDWALLPGDPVNTA